MTILRQQLTVAEDGKPIPVTNDPEGNPYPRVPVISFAVTHGDTVYLSGITAHPLRPSQGIRAQTREVLERIDELLAGAGTDKSKLLTAQVWLADMSDFSEHNEEWNAWVDLANPPVRACVQATLIRPVLLVEIMVTAAR
jgi:enamine deaminase RidA (YjgF/YER057c/UK114 family)